MLQVALPNKGSLSDDAIEIVKEAGYKCRRTDKQLSIVDRNNDTEFLFLRPRDISVYVNRGIIDTAITGRDLVLDSDVNVAELLPLGFGFSRFFYAVPENSDLTPESLSGKRIATSYPNLVRMDLEKRNLDADVIELDGAIEISVRLGVADAIADVVETGKTLEQAGLRTVGNPILESEAIVIARNKQMQEKEGVGRFLKRLNGIVMARSYAMMEYDIPRAQLDEASRITPGIESPTVAPLNEEGWVAVKSMIRKEAANDVMEQLTDLGAKGIIVSDIRTCRIG